MSRSGGKDIDYPKKNRLKPLTKDRFQKGKIDILDEDGVDPDDLPNIWDRDPDETDGSDETPEGSVLKGIYEQE